MTQTDSAAGEPRAISGFWRRLVAFIIDILLLWLVGAGLGHFLFDQLAAMGEWGRLVGFVIAVVYFAVWNSSLGGGHTLGKELMHIKVVDADGRPLAAPRSFGRATILCVPYFLNGAVIDPGLRHTWLGIADAVLVFGMGGAIVYLFVFNRATRQSLHDLAVGSYVIRAAADSPHPIGVPWRGHVAVVTLLLLAAASLPVITGKLAQKQPFASLLRVQKQALAEPGVRSTWVMVGERFTASTKQGTQRRRYMKLSVILATDALNRQRLADRIARIALDGDADAAGRDEIDVSLAYGYDIGIASSWHTQRFALTPTQWKARLATKTNDSL